MWPERLRPPEKWRVTSRDAPFSDALPCKGRRVMVIEDDVRRIAPALPETPEKTRYGTPAFSVRGKWFARIKEEGDPLGAEEEKAAPGRERAIPHTA
ncbi:hypothetical protein GCM10022419_040620 [Nonomuraea rosea]|uniref:Uncharacterized protein n=1 Tax=Nonomuraea rosea TaxID=638574 RepID=A0ABP6WTG4_9ACTN